MASSNEQVVTELLQAIGTGNEAAVKASLDPACVYYENGQLVSTGRDEYWSMVAGYRTAFPDFSVSIDQIFGSGERVAVGVTCRGTHLGPLDEAPATGKTAEFDANILFRLAAGQVVEDRTVVDTLGMMQQLGLV